MSFSFGGRWLRLSQRLTAALLLAVLIGEWAIPASAATRPEPHPQPLVRLPGHVSGALQRAIPVPANPDAESEPLTLTLTLRRGDQAGFDRYLHDVYDPHSPRFRHFLSQAQITARFGPTKTAYNQVLAYLKQNGFTLTQGSANRLTVTVQGTRSEAERALGLRIGDYLLENRHFYANDENPALPASIAERVAAVSGLSDLARPVALISTGGGTKFNNACNLDGVFLAGVSGGGTGFAFAGPLGTLLGAIYGEIFYGLYCAGVYVGNQQAKADANHNYIMNCNNGILTPPSQDPKCIQWHNVSADPPPNTPNQKIGFLEFDTFHTSDVADQLAFLYGGPTALSRLHVVPVNGGIASPGPGESEVLLDIDVVMLVTGLTPSISYAVYVAPPSTSFQQLFNAMINDGDTIISNSWSQCEDQTSLADAQSIDSVLAQAAASGISVFNGSGDSGATCLDGSPNTIGVPADSPHATAVGGSTPIFGIGFTYGEETWWNGPNQVPASGSGGFGVSKYFPRPSYQDGLTGSAMRSVPDLVLGGDPEAGIAICQADAGGCPTGLLYGGTSLAAPTMAGMTALLNASLGSNVGEVNPVLYSLAGTTAFNAAGSFANVGLGSPNFNYIRLALSNGSVGPANASNSDVLQSLSGVPNDGSRGVVRVNLYDANFYPVSGKTVTLAANAGSHAVITPADGISSVHGGAVVFTVTDNTIEDVTLTVTDVTDGVVLTQTATISFVAPPAAAGGIVASPNSVSADGSSATTITITLQDAKGNPTPGKIISLSQGDGHSVITALNEGVTDVNGEAQFSATDLIAEPVTYTAVNVTDGNLPVPGNAQVSFTGAGVSCVSGSAAAAAGFTLTPFANGFASANLFYSNVSWGCQGAYNPTFDANGNVFVSDFINGNLYELPQTGGAASSADILANLGLTVERPVFGKDGSMYVARGATGSGFHSGVVLKIDPNTGATLSTLASGLTCPSTLLVDPISGDLFFGDTCFGAGADNPSIWRISNPASATPTMSVYATLPSTPTVGNPGFAPDGTLYVAYGQPLATAPIARIAGTNTASPGSLTTLPGITTGSGVSVVQAQPNGAAKGLLVTNGTNLVLVDITTNPFTSTVLATGALNQFGSLLLSPGSVGPDGCLYFSSPDTVFRLAPTAGPCGFVPTNPAPSLDLSPTNVSPNPAQGTTTNFTATLRNVSQPQGTPVTFLVGGANSLAKMVRTDSNGQATLSYSGTFIGSDRIFATATLDSGSVTSNVAQVTWAAGRHTTFLTLNLSPTGGSVGQDVTVAASLADISSTPAAAIGNANVTFTLGKSQCGAVTDANGTASCMVIPGAAGLLSLNAAFPGNVNYVNSSASAAFIALGPVGPPPASKCPLNQGHWKANAANWPVNSLMLGMESYSDAELLSILNTPSAKGKKGDASLLLAHELITAKLNIANGSDPTPVNAIIADADKLLGEFGGKLPYSVVESSQAGKAMMHDEAVLVQYENGKFTPKCGHHGH